MTITEKYRHRFEIVMLGLGIVTFAVLIGMVPHVVAKVHAEIQMEGTE